uniref:Uncharacterized protein n=1 Tax=Anguilla anguilla TaxID=7936 RepID=A0A0E9UVR2_ANGAN
MCVQHFWGLRYRAWGGVVSRLDCVQANSEQVWACAWVRPVSSL